MTERIPLTGGRRSFQDLKRFIRQSGNYTGRANLSDAEMIELLKITEAFLMEQGKGMKKLGKAEGGLLDEGGSVDPVSGNDVPIGSTKEEVRDDIPAQLSEGEFVFPADVVRYIGLEKLMMMRQEAKQGLKKMEAMGQMGNSDEATVPDDLPFDETDIIAEDDDGNEVEMAVGGLTPSSKYNQFMGGAGIRQVVYVNPKTGDEILVYVVSGTPIPAVPAGYVPKGSEQASADAIKESKMTNPIEQPETVQEDKDETYTVYQGKIINPGNPISLDKDSGADTWANLEGETIFDRAVDQSKAPAGWTTQNQREYDAMVAENVQDIKAMWNGKEWDVYSPSLDTTAFGTPGRRGLKSKYGNLFKDIQTGFSKATGTMGAITGTAQAINAGMVSNLRDAMTSVGTGITQRVGDASAKARKSDAFKPKVKKGKRNVGKDPLSATQIKQMTKGKKTGLEGMSREDRKDFEDKGGTVIQTDKDKQAFKDRTGIDIGKDDDEKEGGISKEQMRSGI
tara:strand:+ start:5374 stop:6897 length:1524 start_codon:yes stop_codon:yes gene_type:complete